VSRRRWNVNLRPVRARVNGANKRVRVCTTCLKSGKVVKRPLAKRPETVAIFLLGEFSKDKELPLEASSLASQISPSRTAARFHRPQARCDGGVPSSELCLGPTMSAKDRW